jgi:hypothetical protein
VDGGRGSYRGYFRRDWDKAARQKMTDAVEKGKNEPIEIFARAPVEMPSCVVGIEACPSAHYAAF